MMQRGMTLETRRSTETVCSFHFIDSAGASRSVLGRRAQLHGGGGFDLFRTGALAAVLECCPQTILGWEQRVGFPRPRWTVVRSDGVRLTSRLYSHRQVYALGWLHRHFGFLRGRFRERVYDFAFSASLVFDDVDHLAAGDVETHIRAALLFGRVELAERLRPVDRTA